MQPLPLLPARQTMLRCCGLVYLCTYVQCHDLIANSAHIGSPSTDCLLCNALVLGALTLLCPGEKEGNNSYSAEQNFWAGKIRRPANPNPQAATRDVWHQLVNSMLRAHCNQKKHRNLIIMPCFRSRLQTGVQWHNLSGTSISTTIGTPVCSTSLPPSDPLRPPPQTQRGDWGGAEGSKCKNSSGDNQPLIIHIFLMILQGVKCAISHIGICYAKPPHTADSIPCLSQGQTPTKSRQSLKDGPCTRSSGFESQDSRVSLHRRRQ